MASIRVLIVDDHAVFSDALAIILRTEPDMDVVGTGATVQEAINAARALQPDVVLLDVHMPDGSGIAGLRNEPSLAGGRVFVGSDGGHVYMLSP